MLDIKIPKEIRGYGVKTFGPFTTRQAVWFVISAVGAILIYSAEKALLNTSNPPLVPLLIPAIPGVVMGWGDKWFNMKPEDYFRYVWIPNKKRSVNRKYVIENYNGIVAVYKKEKKKAEIEKKEELSNEKKKNKKNKKSEKVVIPKELEKDLIKF